MNRPVERVKTFRQDDTLPENSLRAPAAVMKLERLGSYHPNRISFTRTLVRRMHSENWQFEVFRNTLDQNGYGDMVYCIHTPAGQLSFIAFSNALDERDRTDRVIAEKWDMAFTLFNGIATTADIDRLRDEVPRQEAGRMSASEIVLSRANKSVRLFQSVVDHLASGRQPPVDEMIEIGYLIRTTAVYGNGKFGLMDFHRVRERTPFHLPFQAEMLTVYMARQFSLDLVDHIARCRGSERAVPLARPIRKSLGVGNATGLGMAPFLIGHPQLIHQWMWTREIAIARVKSVVRIEKRHVDQFTELLGRVSRHLEQWNTADERQFERILVLREEVEQLKISQMTLLQSDYPWARLADEASKNGSLEFSEMLHSLMLEIYPELADELDQNMGVAETARLDATTTLEELRFQIEKNYAWALEFDFSEPDSEYFFWYVSAEKEEPRLGERYNEPGAEVEMPIGIARDVSRLHCVLCKFTVEYLEQTTVAEFLLAHPKFRFIITRIHSLIDYPYAEIQDNLLAADCLPINLLRCKLATFGATRFDPKSDLWTRITLFQGAPLVDELERPDADDWAFPVFCSPTQ